MCAKTKPADAGMADTDAAGATAVVTEAPAAGPAAPDSTAVAIDSASVAALTRMGNYLRSLKAFQVKAATTRDEVLTSGQLVQFSGTSDILARVPDRLRAVVTSDRKERTFLYNGKQFTVWAGRLNYYASVPAPPTIGKLADVLRDKYAIELPLVDLFDWGTAGARVGDIKAAVDVGASQVEGVTCEHYAFRQEGLDWQIWIQKGDYPLPRKLILTTLTDEARPQYTAVLTWNLAPSYNDAAFTFDPPKDAHKIVLADVNAPPGAIKQ
jgi:hypothetical protein